MKHAIPAWLLFSCLAFPSATPAQTQAERQFHAAAARAIYQVMPEERERFALGMEDPANPVFAGVAPNSVEQMPCERRAAFQFIGYANTLGTIVAAACRDGARVRKLSAQSRAGLAQTLAMLRVGEEAARKAGWYYALEKQPDGAEFHYFPVLAIGHGVLAAHTGALYDGKSGVAVVVQAAPYPMCEHFRREFGGAPFCADIRQALKAVARALQAAHDIR